MKPTLPVILAAAFVLTITADVSHCAAQTTEPVVDALVKFKEDIPLPAKEAGVLLRLGVEEGDAVKKGQDIGLIDDTEPQMQKKVATYARDAAVKRAKDDIEIRYAKAQAVVLGADYEQLLETNKMAARAVTEVELRKAKLDWDRSILAIEKSQKDQELARYEAYTKQAELEATDQAVKRRMIISPLDGEVAEIHRKQDEWVAPGDAILRLVRRDVMHVEGALDQSAFDPHELQGRDVSVEVQLARGRTETVPGRIIYVSPLVSYDGRYIVRAEVPNRRVTGNWILMDGQSARMKIHVNAAARVPEISRTP